MRGSELRSIARGDNFRKISENGGLGREWGEIEFSKLALFPRSGKRAKIIKKSHIPFSGKMGCGLFNDLRKSYPTRRCDFFGKIFFPNSTMHIVHRHWRAKQRLRCLSRHRAPELSKIFNFGETGGRRVLWTPRGSRGPKIEVFWKWAHFIGKKPIKMGPFKKCRKGPFY